MIHSLQPLVQCPTTLFSPKPAYPRSLPAAKSSVLCLVSSLRTPASSLVIFWTVSSIGKPISHLALLPCVDLPASVCLVQRNLFCSTLLCICLSLLIMLFLLISKMHLPLPLYENLYNALLQVDFCSPLLLSTSFCFQWLSVCTCFLFLSCC